MFRPNLAILFLSASLLFNACQTTEVSPASTAPAPAPARLHTPVLPQNESDLIHNVMANGLHVLVKENHTAPVAALRIYVKTGSIYEQEYLGYGISHIFEHLISGGTTKTRSEAEIRELLDFLGGRNNAYTTKDHTAYHITTSSDKINQAIDLMADWMINSTFPENEYKREMNVVLQELYKGREEPDRVFQKVFDETVFRVHPVKYPVIGHEALLKKITHQDIVDYYHRMYAPNNMIVVAVGDFDGKAVAARIETAFNAFNRRAMPAICLPKEPQQLGKRSRIIENPKVRGATFRIGFRSVTIDHPDLYALDVLSYILSHGRSSRLVSSIVEQQRLATSIYSYSHTPAYDAGIFAIGGQCPADKVEAAVEEAIKETRKLQTELVDDETLEKAKRQKIADDVLYNQTPEDQASDLATNLMTTGNPEFSKLYLTKIRSVTADQVREVANKYLIDETMTIVIMRPPAKKRAARTAQNTSKAAQTQKVVLDNGLRVLIRRNPTVPVVSLQAYFLGGVRLEPRGKAGVSNITGSLLTRGTTSRTADQISKAFDAMGGTYSSSAGNNTMGLNVEVLNKDFDDALDLFADMLLNPAFPEPEFDKLKERTLARLERYDDDWFKQINRVFRRQYFGNHPYANVNLGTTADVAALTVDDVRRFYLDHVTPQQGVITIFGDIDVEETLAKVKAHLGSFTRAAKPIQQPSAPALPTKERIVSHPVERGISAIFVGYPGIRYTDVEDRYVLTVINALLDTRLFEELRGKRDLVYLANCISFAGLDPGYFGIVSATTPNKMPQVQKIIIDETKRLTNEPITPKELEKAKAICLNSEILGKQTNADMGLQALLDELYGLGYSHSSDFKALIDKITPVDVQRVAKKHFTHPLIVRTDGASAPPRK